MKLSVVAPLYKSADTVAELVDRIRAAASQVAGANFEIILVDDGCPEGSGEVAYALQDGVPQLRVITLSRNFGQHKALLTGAAQSSGDFVYMLDGDLDEEPEWLVPFFEELSRTEVDVVFGYQPSKRRGALDSVIGWGAYTLIRVLTGLPIRNNLVTSRLMTREYVDALVSHRDRVTWLAGLWHITGFRQKGLQVTKLERSKTSYGFGARMAHFSIATLTFSTRPLRIIFVLASISFIFGLAVGAVTALRAIDGQLMTGWPSVFASIWIASGMILFGLGIVALNQSTILEEVRDRPYVTIRKTRPPVV